MEENEEDLAERRNSPEFRDPPDEAAGLRSDGNNRSSVIFSSFEQALKVVGAFGSYQIGFILCIQLSVVLWCGNFVFMAYASYEPIVTCIHASNNSTSLLDNFTITLNHDKPEAFCEIFEAGNCLDVTWSAPFYTVVEEWELICSRDWIPQMINSVQMAGTVVATVFAGVAADFLGRKLVFYVTFALFLVCGVLSTFSTGPIMFAICRFFVGAMLSASIMTNFVWGMEITDQKHNVIVNCSFLWHFAYMITALIGYLTAKWTTYLLVVNAIGAPLLVLFTSYHESPRWLIQKGQLERAARLLTKIADTNRPAMQRVEISADNLAELRNQEELAKGTPWWMIFTHPKLRVFTAVSASLYTAASAAATAYIFQVSLLPGSPFFKFFLYGVLRVWIPFVIYYADRTFARFGRRLMLLVPMGIVFGCYFATTIAASIGNYPTFFFVGTLSGAVICNVLWVAMGQYTIELFPTVLRNTAVSVSTLCDPLVGVLMPQLIYLERHWRSLPFFFVAVCTGISLLLAYFILPETKGKPLPDTVADMDKTNFAYQDWKEQGSWRRQLKQTCCVEEEVSLIGNVDESGEDVIFDYSNQEHFPDDLNLR